MEPASRKEIGQATPPPGRTTLGRERTRAWLYPLLATLVVAAVGAWAYRTLEDSLQTHVREELQTILDADVAALRIWMNFHLATVKKLAADPQLVDLAKQLRALEREGKALASAAAQASLRGHVTAELGAYGCTGFAVLDENGRILGCDRDAALGQSAQRASGEFINRVLAGEALLTPPHRLKEALPGVREDARHPEMYAAAPLKDAEGNIWGGVGFGIRADDFTRILSVGRMGSSGETYAFDRQGVLISHSRFDDQLRRIGLLPDGAPSILNVEIRDPGGDLLEGHRPDRPRAGQPLTRMAAAAVSEGPGVDVDGYRSYRGVEVVGAWTWLAEHDFGVATEVESAEAYEELSVVRLAFHLLMALLLLSAAVMFLSSRRIYRLRHQMSEAKQLGQYTLEEKIGEGAMGAVYRARHAMLRRPTALKLLAPDDTTEETLGRFEREVQLTARLTHPNTVAVYDYGRSPEGVFYYAMEYLDGINLDRLVADQGPLPPGLVVHLLRQACGSLAEAHGIGLIHRDIKPANLMVCARGGMPDMVKVLDFGLVKDVRRTDQPELSMVGQIVGTPHYISPEALRDPAAIDARADLYAVGAVGYYLLSGKTVFSGGSVPEIINYHLNTPPEPPSQRLGRTVPAQLEAIVLRCLEKEPGKRFDDADELRQALDALGDVEHWTAEAAANWWGSRSGPLAKAAEDLEATLGDRERLSQALRIDFRHRGR
ncbi:MAG: protein kinase domain-containing protein [Planctomycetota bacterium]